MPTPDDIFTRGKINGRHALLTMITVILAFFVLVLTGLQVRHHWPLEVTDGIDTGAIGVFVASAFWVYRVRR